MFDKTPESKDWLGEVDFLDDEEIPYWDHPSIFPLLNPFVFVLVSTVAGIGIFYLYEPPFRYAGPALFLVSLFSGTAAFIRWITTHYILTDYKAIKKTGIVSADKDYVEYEDIDDINAVQGGDGILNSIIERHILGIGDIEIRTSSGENLRFEKVANYDGYRGFLNTQNSKNTFREQMEKHREVTGLAEEQKEDTSNESATAEDAEATSTDEEDPQGVEDSEQNPTPEDSQNSSESASTDSAE